MSLAELLPPCDFVPATLRRLIGNTANRVVYYAGVDRRTAHSIFRSRKGIVLVMTHVGLYLVDEEGIIARSIRAVDIASPITLGRNAAGAIDSALLSVKNEQDLLIYFITDKSSDASSEGRRLAETINRPDDSNPQAFVTRLKILRDAVMPDQPLTFKDSIAEKLKDQAQLQPPDGSPDPSAAARERSLTLDRLARETMDATNASAAAAAATASPILAAEARVVTPTTAPSNAGVGDANVAPAASSRATPTHQQQGWAAGPSAMGETQRAATPSGASATMMASGGEPYRYTPQLHQPGAPGTPVAPAVDASRSLQHAHGNATPTMFVAPAQQQWSGDGTAPTAEPAAQQPQYFTGDPQRQTQPQPQQVHTPEMQHGSGAPSRDGSVCQQAAHTAASYVDPATGNQVVVGRHDDPYHHHSIGGDGAVYRPPSAAHSSTFIDPVTGRPASVVPLAPRGNATPAQQASTSGGWEFAPTSTGGPPTHSNTNYAAPQEEGRAHSGGVWAPAAATGDQGELQNHTQIYRPSSVQQAGYAPLTLNESLSSLPPFPQAARGASGAGSVVDDRRSSVMGGGGSSVALHPPPSHHPGYHHGATHAPVPMAMPHPHAAPSTNQTSSSMPRHVPQEHHHHGTAELPSPPQHGYGSYYMPPPTTISTAGMDAATSDIVLALQRENVQLKNRLAETEDARNRMDDEVMRLHEERRSLSETVELQHARIRELTESATSGRASADDISQLARQLLMLQKQLLAERQQRQTLIDDAVANAEARYDRVIVKQQDELERAKTRAAELERVFASMKQSVRAVADAPDPALASRNSAMHQQRMNAAALNRSAAATGQLDPSTLRYSMLLDA